MGMACIPMSIFFGHSDAFGHLHQCLRVSKTKPLPGTALVLLMDRAPWPLSFFLCWWLPWITSTKTKILILIRIVESKMSCVTSLSRRRNYKTKTIIHVENLGEQTGLWPPPVEGKPTLSSTSRYGLTNVVLVTSLRRGRETNTSIIQNTLGGLMSSFPVWVTFLRRRRNINTRISIWERGVGWPMSPPHVVGGRSTSASWKIRWVLSSLVSSWSPLNWIPKPTCYWKWDGDPV